MGLFFIVKTVMKCAILLFFFSSTTLCALSQNSSPLQEKRVLIPSLEGLIIYDEKNPPSEYAVKGLSGIEIYRTFHDVSEKKKNSLKNALTKCAIGKPLTHGTMDEITTIIDNFCKKHLQNIVAVEVKEPDPSSCILQISILESVCGNISIQGNKHHSDHHYIESLHLERNNTINKEALASKTNWINRKRNQKVNVVYKQGDNPGVTDIDILIEDEKPLAVYLGSNNDGVKVLGTTRIFAGFDWDQFLSLDQKVCYRYTSSPNTKEFQSHSLIYTASLPFKHLISIATEYTKVESRYLEKTSGFSLETNSLYKIPFQFGEKWLHEVGGGIHFSKANNDLIVGIPKILSCEATIFQLSPFYETSYQTKEHLLSFSAKGYWQPFTLGQSMSQDVYSQFRKGASTRYFFAKLVGKYEGKHLLLQVQGQVSTKPLIPLLQYGLGGINTVHGYNERAINVDSGAVCNFVLKSPKISLFLKNKERWAKGQDALQALFFADLAYGVTLREKENYFLMGVGPGIRYTLGPWLNFRFDWGVRLTPIPSKANTHAISRPYFSLVAAY